MMNNATTVVELSRETLKESSKFRRIGSGIHREVYVVESNVMYGELKGKVIKSAAVKEGVEANRAEVQTWMCVKGTELEQFFCPVRDFSDNYRYVVFDFAAVCESSLKVDEFRKEVEQKIYIGSVRLESHGDDGDIRTENIGNHPRYGLVMIDYPWGQVSEEKQN